LSALATFIIIAYLSRRSGFKVALGAAIVGTIAAPMIFELPFDLIVITRTYPPKPEVLLARLPALDSLGAFIFLPVGIVTSSEGIENALCSL
jgi:hypothetical protein